MVLPEAGAADLALVSTDVGAIHEIVRDGETGLLVAPGDQAALTEALRTLVADAELRARLGRAAGEMVRADHDAAANAARLADLLAEVSRRRPARQPLLARRR
jgi:glycosyltransferase involved in cell wall biosynthesis